MIPRDSFLADLSTLIAFRTVAPDAEAKRACLHWVRDNFLTRGALPVEEGMVADGPYLYVPHPDPKLLWFAHLDVVPGRDDQFTMRIDGDEALGRGVKDMKGAALAFLTAYREACATGTVPPVSILLTTDEEIAGHTPEELIATGMFDHVPVCYTPDNGEKNVLVHEFKGVLAARLSIMGKSGHGSTPWDCDNPVWHLADALAIVRQRFPQGTDDDWQMTVTPTELKGSDAFNRIPARADATLDIRFPASVARTLKEALAIVKRELPAHCSLKVIHGGGPLHTDPAHPMITLYRSIAEEVTGGEVRVGREHGSSDARSFSERGIAAFLHGPRGGNLHGEREWVSVTSLREQIEIGRRWLRALSA